MNNFVFYWEVIWGGNFQRLHSCLHGEIGMYIKNEIAITKGISIQSVTHENGGVCLCERGVLGVEEVRQGAAGRERLGEC